jgi:hypothetical protein
MTASKIVLNAASGVGGAGLDVDEVFSNLLYTGNNTANRVINNGIDLAGEGGMVWTKIRYPAGDHSIWTTDIGAGYRLIPNGTNTKITDSGLTSFNNNGFTIQDNSSTNPNNNYMVSWTFRKSKKFFDVVTWDGNNTAGREIAHNLGTTVGTIIVKCTSNSSTAWTIYHRSLGSTKYLEFDTGAQGNAGTAYWNSTEPTNTAFTLGNDGNVNATGRSYVAYLFAHNDGDGDFGPDADQDIIKCGSYTGNGNDNGPEIDLGFEPQWVMVKNTTDVDSWYIFDVMRGMYIGGSISYPVDTALRVDSSSAETGTGEPAITPTATGFKVTTNQGWMNNNNANLIYIAIRRGSLNPPESATDVFSVIETNSASQTEMTTGFPVDAQLAKATSSGSNGWLVDRLRGVRTRDSISTPGLRTNSADGTNLNTGYSLWWNSTGFAVPPEWSSVNTVFYNWKRAPNFFDIVGYSGNSTIKTVSHNLGVVPEMMIIKSRGNSKNWTVYHKDLGAVKRLNLNNNTAATNEATAFNSTTPTSSVFTVGTSDNTNENPFNYIAYLFASLDGVSKVGSYTGNGSSQTIDCGFSSGARFVLIKQTDTSGASWWVFDSERGIVSGNDSALRLNTTDAAVTNEDAIDPVSSGFSVTNSGGYIDTNNSGGSYIFYAIA